MDTTGGMTIEDAMKSILVESKKGIEENRDRPNVCAAYKKMGRHALTLFDWNGSDWAKEYHNLFAEEKPRSVFNRPLQPGERICLDGVLFKVVNPPGQTRGRPRGRPLRVQKVFTCSSNPQVVYIDLDSGVSAF